MDCNIQPQVTSSMLTTLWCNRFLKIEFIGEQAVQYDVQCMIKSGIAEVEYARHLFGGNWPLSPAFSKFADLSNVSVDGGVGVFELSCLVEFQILSTEMNLLHDVAGRLLAYRLKRFRCQ